MVPIVVPPAAVTDVRLPAWAATGAKAGNARQPQTSRPPINRLPELRSAFMISDSFLYDTAFGVQPNYRNDVLSDCICGVTTYEFSANELLTPGPVNLHRVAC